MRLGVHAVGAKVGGGVTYLKHVLPLLVSRLAQREPAAHVVLWHSGVADGDAAWTSGVELRAACQTENPELPATPLQRLWFDQFTMPREARDTRLDAVFATANYCSLAPACRQVLLVRNSLPFDEVFLRRLSRRARLRFGLQRLLMLRSVAAADVVLFPSDAMRQLVGQWVGGSKPHWRVAHYGLSGGIAPAAVNPQRRDSRVHLLHVSTYSDQKNLGTMLRALELLDSRAPQTYALRLTAGFNRARPSAVYPNFDADLKAFRNLAARGVAEDTDWVEFSSLPAMYQTADIFLFPSYSESFGHPLIEAMASGLPVVSADTPVNRELCGDAAKYVSTFDHQALADVVHSLAKDPAARETMRNASIARARQFTWAAHVEAAVGALAGT